MRKRKSVFLEKQGLRLLALPTTNHDKANEERRNIRDLHRLTAAELLSRTGVTPNGPLLLCGAKNKLVPFLRCLTRRASPYVLVGTQRDHDDLPSLPWDWEAQQPTARLPDGNGRMVLRPGGETALDLKECLSGWSSHFVVLFLGGGLKVDGAMLDILDGLGRYALVMDSPVRSVKEDSDGGQLSVEKVIASMDGIIVSSISTAAKELLSVLPSYEAEVVSNTTDLSVHQDGPLQEAGAHHRLHGLGGRLSQSRMLQTKALLTEEELTALQDSNTVVLYNARSRHTYVGRVTR